MDYSSGFHSGATSTLYLLKPRDTNNLAPEWADADFDARHRLVASEIWELPFGANRRWLREGVWSQIAGGWSASGMYTFKSGFPYNVFDGNDPCLRAGGYAATCRPNLVGDPSLPASDRNATRSFNTAEFRKTAPGEFGTTPRNAIRGPSLRNVDLSFSRRVGLDVARDEPRGACRRVQCVQRRQLRRAAAEHRVERVRPHQRDGDRRVRVPVRVKLNF